MVDRVTPEMVQYVKTLLDDEIAALTKARGGKYPGGQRAIAAKLHVAQPTLNRFLKKSEGLGIDMLMGLRAYFYEAGRPKSIDEILGIDVVARPVLDAEAVLARVAELEASMRQLADRVRPRGQSQKAAKILADAEKERLRAVAQEHMDKRHERLSTPKPGKKTA